MCIRSGAASTRATALLVAFSFLAACSSSKKPEKKPKSQPAKPARKQTHRQGITRHSMPPRTSHVELSIQEVEALLERAKPPKGGQVLALVYAGGIKGEIEPCG